MSACETCAATPAVLLLITVTIAGVTAELQLCVACAKAWGAAK